MGLFDKIFGIKENKTDWEAIRLSAKAYPAHSFSIQKIKTKSGKMVTGWVDKTYAQYLYKEFCPYHFLIQVDLDDSIAINNPDLDMGSIQTWFAEELRKVGVAHMVARMVTEEGMNIEMYVEQEQAAKDHLDKIIADPARLVSFTYEVNKDPKWEAVNGLLNP